MRLEDYLIFAHAVLTLEYQLSDICKMEYLAGRAVFLTEWGHFYVLKTSRHLGALRNHSQMHQLLLGNFEVTKTSPPSKHCNSLIVFKSHYSSVWFMVQQESVRGPFQREVGCTGVQDLKGDCLLDCLTSDFRGTRQRQQPVLISPFTS